MKTLYLPLKKEWYEMIESGIKTEEYREIKPYWANRLLCSTPSGDIYYRLICLKKISHEDVIRNYGYAPYTHVRFSYGYTKRTMAFEIRKITIGIGKAEWGATNENMFIINIRNQSKLTEYQSFKF